MPPLLKCQWDFSKLFEGLEKYDASTQFAGFEAAVDIGHDGLGRMIDAAPLQTGMLRGSGSVHVDGNFLAASPVKPTTGAASPETGSIGGKRARSTVIVWGFNTHYAAKVHENPWAGRIAGGWKYVSRIIEERAQIWMEFFAKRIREARS